MEKLIKENMTKIGIKILVLSGSKNVGKSAVALALNGSLANLGFKVALLKAESSLQLKENLATSNFGQLDYLIIDTPSSITEADYTASNLIKEISGALIVVSAKKGPLLQYQRALAFCRENRIAILGVIENFSTSETTKEYDAPFVCRIEENSVTLLNEAANKLVEATSYWRGENYEK